MTDRSARNLSEALRFPWRKVQSRHYKALREAYSLQQESLLLMQTQILELQRLCGSVRGESSWPTPDS